MQNDNRTLPVTFKNTGAAREADLARLITGMTNFLDHYCHPSLVEQSFLSLVGDDNGAARFERLLAGAGFGDDPYGFFEALISSLGAADGSAPISLNECRDPAPGLDGHSRGDPSRQPLHLH
jgi:hypothetical protein